MSAVAVDFDGVIHAYSKGWHDGTIYDATVPGALRAIRMLMAQHAVFVHTTREASAVAAWLTAREMPTALESGPQGIGPVDFWHDQTRVLVTNRKLPALAYIDDRAIRFESWPQALAELDRLLDPTTDSQRCELTELLIDQCGCPTHRGGQTPDEEADEYADYRDSDSETPGPWFEASFYGTCSRCQEPFKPGHRIRADGGHGWECCNDW